MGRAGKEGERYTMLSIGFIFDIPTSGSRNRESLVPAIAEGPGIAYTGSDAVSLGISLATFKEPILVEEFISGRELTV